MSEKLSISSLILIFIFLTLSISSCGGRMITGQVVDAETGKPMEKAAVYIAWFKSGSGPIGLAGSVRVEVADDLTDAKGIFKVPKYSTMFKHYDMAVYKKGYVCWSSRKIFPTYEERKGFKLKNGMVIEMGHFKEEYSKLKHARFTIHSSINRNDPGIFNTAIKSERELRREIYRRNRRE